MATNDRAPKPNRDQRRDEEFGRDQRRDERPPAIRSPWTSDDVPANESVTGRPDQDQTHLTGAGAGGATESGGRLTRHEGTHATNTQKG
jgi:hypothetical protein